MNTSTPVTLMLAGDVMTGRGIDQALSHPGDPRLFESHVCDARDYVALAERVNGPVGAPLDGDDLWGPALDSIARAAPDLRIVNLETAVTSVGEPCPEKGIHYRMHPANIDCLTVARLDCCVLANNHVLDYEGIGAHGALRSDAGCIYFVTMESAPGGGRATLLQVDLLALQMKRLRLQLADAAARTWLGTVFDRNGTRLGPPRRANLPESWSIRW